MAKLNPLAGDAHGSVRIQVFAGRYRDKSIAIFILDAIKLPVYAVSSIAGMRRPKETVTMVQSEAA